MFSVAYHMLCIFGMQKSFKARVHCTMLQESNLLINGSLHLCKEVICNVRMLMNRFTTLKNSRGGEVGRKERKNGDLNLYN